MPFRMFHLDRNEQMWWTKKKLKHCPIKTPCCALTLKIESWTNTMWRSKWKFSMRFVTKWICGFCLLVLCGGHCLQMARRGTKFLSCFVLRKCCFTALSSNFAYVDLSVQIYTVRQQAQHIYIYMDINRHRCHKPKCEKSLQVYGNDA